MKQRFYYLTLSLVIFFISPAGSYAAQDFTYTHDGYVLEGYVVSPNTSKYPGNRPVVLVVHQWKGLGAYEKSRAEMLAELGYIAFAVDIYGQGIRPKTQAEAAAESAKYKNNPDLARGRMRAALEAINLIANADSNKVAVIGYCFGGTMALELARSGVDFKAAVSFHGGLATEQRAMPGAVQPAIQVHHGDIDPYVTPEEVASFKQEMATAEADWHFISYSDAVHSFTEKAAGDDPSKGVAYNARADQRSWVYTLAFLSQALK